MKKLHSLFMAILVMAMSISVVSASTRTEEQKVLSSDGAFGDVFGFPMAQDGNTAVAGARNSLLFQGSAYVLERMDGQWTEKQKLTASDGTPFEFFGSSVAIRGNTILVGATNAFNDNGVGSGAVYVFEKVDGTWVEKQKLADNTSGEVGDSFGIATALEGNTLIVAAQNHNGSAFRSGILYVFEKVANTWVEDARILPSDTAAGDRFGINVAMEGDTIVVGAPKVGFFGVPIGAGSAYVFTRSATGWSEEAILTAGVVGVVNNRFGFRVAIAGNTVVVGAPESGINGPKEDAGSVYVFTRAGNDWSQQARLTASDGAIGDRFGTGLAVSDNTVVVGATAHNSAEGAAYVFERSGTVWSEVDKLVASDAIQGTSLGEAVAISGNDILVGASNIDSSVPLPNPLTGPGAVYVFER